LADQREVLKKQVGRALDAYSGAHPVGVWARPILGIEPIIAAGLLARIDIARAPTVGHIWRFAGLDPTTTWAKGTKQPWNGSLKRASAF
jgi:Transposase IS116/IS110/IS902 family